MDTYIEYFFNEDKENEKKREKYFEVYENINKCVDCGGDRNCPYFNISCYNRR